MISIFYTAAGQRREHTVANKAAGCIWIDEMCAAHPDFCITGMALHQVSSAFGDQGSHELRMN